MESELKRVLNSLKTMQIGQYSGFFGFDGFVDQVLHVVGKRYDEDNYDRIEKIFFLRIFLFLIHLSKQREKKQSKKHPKSINREKQSQYSQRPSICRIRKANYAKHNHQRN